MRLASIALLLVASLTLAARANAAEGMPRLRIDWSSFSDAYLHALTARAATHEGDAPSHARVVTEQSSPWLGGGVLVSLVARDWQGATRLAGGPLAVTDAIRTSRSSRMLVARIGLGGGKIVPFIHVGAGQWRDPDQRRWDAPLQVAGEAGGGFEMLVTASCAIAVEYDWTSMHRDDPRSEPVASRVNGVFAVARWNY